MNGPILFIRQGEKGIIWVFRLSNPSLIVRFLFFVEIDEPKYEGSCGSLLSITNLGENTMAVRLY